MCFTSLEQIMFWPKTAFGNLTRYLLTWKIWWFPNNVRKWQLGFNWAFIGLKSHLIFSLRNFILWSKQDFKRRKLYRGCLTFRLSDVFTLHFHCYFLYIRKNYDSLCLIFHEMDVFWSNFCKEHLYRISQKSDGRFSRWHLSKTNVVST
jgi:hypothetical protein